MAETHLSFTCPVDSLFEATAKVNMLVPVKDDKPVLTNVRLASRDGSLEMTGTDFRSGIYYTVRGATINSGGEGLLNCAKLLELVKEFRGNSATVSFDSRRNCKFEATGGSYKLVGDDPRDYPTLERFDNSQGFSIPGHVFLDMIKKTEFAVSPTESRLPIHGVLFELKSGRFRLVATDNKRLAVAEHSVETTIPDFSVVVPVNLLRSLLRVISKDVAARDAVIGTTNGKVFIRLSSSTAFATTLVGSYPAYSSGLGLVLNSHTDCNVADMLSLLRRAMLVDSGPCVFKFTNGKLRLQAEASSVGAGIVEMDINYTGQDVRVGFSPTYIKEALEAMTSKRCRFSFEGPRKAGVFKEILSGDAEEAVSDKFVYAVMPIIIPSN